MTAEESKDLRFTRMPLLLLVVLMLGLSSCSTVRNAWTDFNAYFNTYYNAQNYFERGVRQVENQQVDYNPERPIRIHPTPAEVAQSEFEEAIARAVDIIHMHEDSRWVDNAVELIGKAYYYQHDFYSGAQNFDEIYNNAIDQTRRQNAVMWRGKIFLEMEEYGAGISYLYNHLNSGEFEWDPEIRAETKFVLAQLYTYTEDWEEARVYLEEGLQDISDRELRFRGWFLLGQVYEIQGDYNNAIYAFERAMNRRNEEFELLYYAHIKKGEMLRNAGMHQQAYDHFHDMSRNDNFFEYLGDIEFHKAKTLHMAGDIDEALDFYKVTLRQEINPPSRKVNSQIYYNIAEIYRDYHLDYATASAYYDSSLTAMPGIEQMPKDFDVELMAESFGEYAELKSETARLDSLLWLGSLDEEEFDAIIDEIRQEKIREMEEEMRAQESGTDVVVDQQDMEETDQIEDHGDSGFLNHLDRERSNRASQQFSAYWGNRPLVDDWRRADAVRLAVREREEEIEEDVDEEELVLDPDDADEQMAMQQVTVDISEVPFEEEERTQMEKDLASASYEIGNVFFMSLDMPDSAAANYERIIENYPESDLVPQALYSLSEVYLSFQDSVIAREYGQQLVDDYPTTIYAERVSERLDIPIPEEALADTSEDTTYVAWRQLQEEFDDQHSQEYAEELRQFAYNHPEAEQAPLALYHASMAYINIAKEDTSYAELQKTRTSKKAEWEEEKAYLESKRDSAQVLLESEDTTLTDDEKSYWQAWADTTISEPDLSEYDPYKNAYWDSVRVVLAELQQEYTDFTFNERLGRIQEEIGKPEEPEPEEDPEADAEARDEDLEYAECEELDRSPEILGGTDDFLYQSGFQETVDQMMLSGEFDVTVIFDEQGTVLEVVYTEEDDPLGFMEELETAILDHMQLSPPRIDSMETKAKCTLTLELQYN